VANDGSTTSGRPWADLPRELADHMRPHLDEVADDMIQEIQTRVREYDRPGDGSYSGTLRLAVERVLHYFVDRVADPAHDPAPVTCGATVRACHAVPARVAVRRPPMTFR
jgi:predicted small metal-binding protein